jgi:O-antigen/teichoic acid export membrane protein
MAIADIATPSWIARQPAWLGVAGRYAVSAAGPLAVSAAHFLASLLFLRLLTAQEFGLFSFVMVVVSFGMSATASLVVVPITQALARGDASGRAICFKINWLVCGGFGIGLGLALGLGGASLVQAAVMGLFGAVFAWRWFARNMAYIDGRMRDAFASDITYSLLLILTLAVLALAHRISLLVGSEVLLAAALLALLPFGSDFMRVQARALAGPRLGDYAPIFRNVSRWALVGVFLTEVTVNAHAYLVTFISGAGAFALLALGMLLLRPSALAQSSLPDLERPAMARAIAARDFAGLDRIRRHFTWGLSAAWIANLALCAIILTVFPALVLKKGYAIHDAALVAIISAAVMGIRVLRTPLAVQLQAAGEFKALAGIGSISSVISVIATLALLLAFGPIASLGGIFLGEMVILIRLRHMTRDWRAKHA